MAGGEIREIEGLGAAVGASAAWGLGSRKMWDRGHLGHGSGRIQNSAPFGHLCPRPDPGGKGVLGLPNADTPPALHVLSAL